MNDWLNEWKWRLRNAYGYRIFDCPTVCQRKTTTAYVDEYTNTEERQQTQAFTANDKKDDTDEQSEPTDGDEEDNLTHSMS